MTFSFECRHRVIPHGQFRVHVVMTLVEGGLQINTDHIETKRQFFLPHENFAMFNLALNAAPGDDPIETARAAVAARKNRAVEQLLAKYSQIALT
jgi:hypothetical protein